MMPNLIDKAEQGAQQTMGVTTAPPAPQLIAQAAPPPTATPAPAPVAAPPQAAPTLDRATPDPGLQPGALSPSVDPRELGYGDNLALASLNSIWSAGDNIIPSFILSAKYGDWDYLKSAAAGHKVDLDKEWDQFGVHNDWAPWAIGGAKFATNILTSPWTYVPLVGGAKAVKLAELQPANALVHGLGFLANKVGMSALEGVAPDLMQAAAKSGALNTLDVFKYGLTTNLQTGTSNAVGAGLARMFGWYTSNTIDGAARTARHQIAGINGPVGIEISTLNQKAMKVGQGIADELVQKGVKASDAKQLVTSIFETRLGNIDYIMSHYYPKAYAKNSKELRDYLLGQQASIAAKAQALGIPEEDLMKYAGQVGSVVGDYEKGLKALTDAAQSAGKQVNLSGSGGEQLIEAQAQQGYRLMGDFAEGVKRAAGSSDPALSKDANALLARIAARKSQHAIGMSRKGLDGAIQDDAYNLIKRLPPQTVDAMISDGSLAKLPLHSDEITDEILRKAVALDPSVTLDEKMLKANAEQIEVFKLNPMVAVDRSYRSLTKDLSNSAFAKTMKTTGLAEGWVQAGKTAGMVTLPDSIVARLDPTMRGLYFDPQAAAAIENFVGAYESPEKIGKFLQVYDEILSSWKMGVLSNPKTQLNNLIGNTLQYQMGNGNPLELSRALKAMRKLTGNPGNAYKDPFIKELIDNGVVGSDLIRGVEPARKGLALLRYYLEPSTRTGLVPEGIAKDAVGFNGFMDDVMKVGMYRTYRAQGMSPKDAVGKLQGFYYNDSPMSQLTSFEKGTVTRLVPFYRWMKNNIPGQLRNMVQNPWAAGRQVSLGLGLGVFGGNRDDGPVFNPQGVSTIDPRTGEAITYRNINMIPALDAWNVYQGISKIATAGQAETGDLGAQQAYEGLSQATQLGPMGGGITPVAGTIQGIHEALSGKNPSATKALKAVTDQIPGLVDLQRLVKATGVLGQPEVKRGVFSGQLPANPDIFGITPEGTSTRSAKETLVNWLGVPTATYRTLKQFKDMDIKDQNRYIKAYNKLVPQLKKAGEVELAGMLHEYVQRLGAYAVSKEVEKITKEVHPSKELTKQGNPKDTPQVNQAQKKKKTASENLDTYTESNQK